MYPKYTAVVLAVLVAAAEANSIALKDKPFFDLIQGDEDSGEHGEDTRVWERTGLSADINSYMDTTVSMLVPFFQNNGLEPMSLPEIEADFSLKPLWITYRGWVHLQNGRLNGLVNIRRSGDQMVSYYNKRLRLRLQLQFTDLQFVYRYALRVLFINKSGGITGTLNRFTIAVDALIDFNNDQIFLQNLSWSDLGRIRVRFSGNWLTDWLASRLVNMVLRIFDERIMDAVINAVRGALQNVIRNINNELRQTIRHLESFN